MSITREVTWGEQFVLVDRRSGGRGFNPAVGRIRQAVGPQIGTRNTFMKLLTVASPGELDEKDLYRAWLFIVALGGKPEEFGLDDSVVPAGMDTARLSELLRPASGVVVSFGCRSRRPRLPVISAASAQVSALAA